jgi:hypothetical protein
MGAINEADPLVADQMRAAIIQDLLEQHRSFSPNSPGGLNVRGLLSDLTGGSGKRSTVEILYPDDEELQKGMEVLDRIVFGGSPASGVDDIIAREREFAVTAGSAATGQSNLGFMLRAFVGMNSAKQMERMLFSPRAVENIRKLGRPGKVDLSVQLTNDVLGNLAQNYVNMELNADAEAKRLADAQEQENDRIQNMQALQHPPPSLF